MRGLWIAIKIIALLAAGGWLLLQPGWASIRFGVYEITIQTGLLIIVVLAALYLAARLYQLWRSLLQVPANLARTMDERSQDKALSALSLGLSAIAAGDVAGAEKQRDRAIRHIRKDHGLVPLLSGMTARLKGDNLAAEAAFRQLLDNRETAFIGIRGLMQTALDRGHTGDALVLARQAARLHPRQGWIAKNLYALELKGRNWIEAEKALAALQKLKLATPLEAAADRAAMAVAQAEERIALGRGEDAKAFAHKAYLASPDFLPAALLWLGHVKGDRRKATALITRSWKNSPHPDLATAWMDMLPAKDRKNPAKALAWAQRLAATNPKAAESISLMADTALNHNLLGEARLHLKELNENQLNVSLCRLHARLAEAEGSPQARADWMERSLTAAPDRTWVCRQTGTVFDRWQAYSPAADAFNVIEWAAPRGAGTALRILPGTMPDTLALIEGR